MRRKAFAVLAVALLCLGAWAAVAVGGKKKSTTVVVNAGSVLNGQGHAGLGRVPSGEGQEADGREIRLQGRSFWLDPDPIDRAYIGLAEMGPAASGCWRPLPKSDEEEDWREIGSIDPVTGYSTPDLPWRAAQRSFPCNAPPSSKAK
jgi:hypothetical protein